LAAWFPLASDSSARSSAVRTHLPFDIRLRCAALASLASSSGGIEN
jgi:hypothetical protein